jgi:peroxiredoxin
MWANSCRRRVWPHRRRMTVLLRPGHPAPWFRVASSSTPRFHFDVAAGRYVVLCFLGSSRNRRAASVVRPALKQHRALFDDHNVRLFFVSNDPDDQKLGRLRESLPGIRHIWDFDQAVSRLYGAFRDDPETGTSRFIPFWLVLDPMLRILHVAPLADADAVMAFIAALPPHEQHAGVDMTAPVLILPRVFEPRFCEHLIGLYQADGGHESGIMSDQDGMTVLQQDRYFKRRRDYEIQDQSTQLAMQQRIHHCLVPEIAKAFQFHATRIERYIVACYAAAEDGHFMPHRDNTTKATAHRRFAVTINLNDDFDGGDLVFPEFGSRRYRAPLGGAAVFSCSLLHEVVPVTRGVRYATLPFLHDEAAETVYAESSQFLGAEPADDALAAAGDMPAHDFVAHSSGE